jgi:hypothetical protein
VDLPGAVQDHFGISVSDYLLMGFAIITLYMEIYKKSFRLSDAARTYAQSVRGLQDRRAEARAELLMKAIDTAKPIQRQLVFRAENLVPEDRAIFSLPRIRGFLDLLSASTEELRAIRDREPAYNMGHISVRISPLERFPIVRLERGRYIVPNFRYLEQSLKGNLRFALQEAYPGNEYNQTLGTLQEIYIRSMISERLPQLVLIPETEYRKARDRNDGPDLTVIDRSAKQLIAIESKAKHVRAATRIAPASDELMNDLDGVLKALRKLPEKIRDLYAGLPEYAEYQDDIDLTEGCTPICWVVMGEGVHFLQDLLVSVARQDRGHFLNKFEFPYCVMGLDTFELGVEVAAHERAKLHELLQWYWEDSKVNGMKNHMTEHFRGLGAELPSSFMGKYADMLFETIEEHDSKS